jgi:hypothetical protein
VSVRAGLSFPLRHSNDSSTFFQGFALAGIGLKTDDLTRFFGYGANISYLQTLAPSFGLKLDAGLQYVKDSVLGAYPKGLLSLGLYF